MDYSGRYRPVRALQPEDDFNHEVESHPFFNESRYVHLIDGGQGLGGWFRIGQRANQRMSEMTVCLYLPDGRLGFMFARPDVVSQNVIEAAGMRFDVVQPLQRMRLQYEGPLFLLGDGAAMEDPKAAFVSEARADARVDLYFDAVAAAHGGELLGDDGEPFDEGEGLYFARAHYDQAVQGSGNIQVGAENWSIHGFGLRDHSWGPRIWQAIPWYRWFPCTFGPDLAICLMVVQQASGELLKTGFLHCDDGALRLVSDIRLVTRYSDDGFYYPLSFNLSFADGSGKRFEVQGETVANAPCRHWRKLPDGTTDKSRIVECMTRYTLNGRVGWGMAEYMDHQDQSDGLVWEGICAGY